MTRHFGPPELPRMIADWEPEIRSMVAGLLDNMKGKNRIDVVDELAFPLPVTVICKILGIPLEDIPRFHKWIEDALDALDLGPEAASEEQQRRTAENVGNVAEFSQLLVDLLDKYAQHPGPGMLSALVHDNGSDGRMDKGALISNAALLLFAGHETSVNLIAHSILSLLRHPRELEKLRRGPELIVPGVDEFLRLESSVQFWHTRTALADIEIAGTIIPTGAPIFLAYGSANRDPQRFENPDELDLERPDNQHLGFSQGIHDCFGGPLARLEVQVAVERVRAPRGEPAAGRRPAAVPAQPDLPRPPPPPGRHRRDPGLSARRGGSSIAGIAARRTAAAAAAAGGAGARARARAGPGEGRGRRRLPLRPAPDGGARGAPGAAALHARPRERGMGREARARRNRVRARRPGDRLRPLGLRNVRELPPGHGELLARSRGASVAGWPGTTEGIAPYLLVPATRFLIPLGSLDPREAAPLSDAALTSYHAVKRSLHLLGPGSTAVVIGAGGLGQMAIQILRALSSSTTVVAVDTAADKLATAQRMGADETLLSGDEAVTRIKDVARRRGTQLVLDMVGVDPTLRMAAQVARVRGHLTIVGLGGGAVPVDFASPPHECSVASPYWGFIGELMEVVSLAQAGKIQMLVEYSPLERAGEAYRLLHEGKIQGRAVITPNG